MSSTRERRLRLGRTTFGFSRDGIEITGWPVFERLKKLRDESVRITLIDRSFQYEAVATNVAPPQETASPNLPSAGLIGTASAITIAARTCDEVWNLVQARARKPQWFKWYLATSLFAGITAPFLGLALAALIPFLLQPYRRARRLDISYDTGNPEITRLGGLASDVLGSLSEAESLWHITHSKSTSDPRRNAGASTLVTRKRTKVIHQSPSFLRLNIATTSVLARNQTICFLPDCLLIFDSTGGALVPYRHMQVELCSTPFIESGKIPRDSRKLASTWRFARLDGGPDLRFNNNREIPVVEYWDLKLTSESGLQVVLQASSEQAAKRALSAFERLKLASDGDSASPSTASNIDSAQQHQRRPLLDGREPAPYVDSDPASWPPQPRFEFVTAAAILLRYVAAADRKITPSEVEYAAKALATISGTREAWLGQFRRLPADDEALCDSFDVLRASSAQQQEWLLKVARELAATDGKITAKEEDRLGDIEYELSLNL